MHFASAKALEPDCLGLNPDPDPWELCDPGQVTLPIRASAVSSRKVAFDSTYLLGCEDGPG